MAADGCFGKDGYFYASPINIDTESLVKLFIHKIFKMLLSRPHFRRDNRINTLVDV